MKKKIAILGSTGSIGKTLIEIIKKDKKNFEITLLTANQNYKELIKQAIFFKVKNLIITDSQAYELSKKIIKQRNIKIYNNYKNFSKIFKKKNDFIMSSISGLDGLEPTLNSVKFTKKILIANKEAIICGWNLIVKEMLKHKTKFIPVDSEHFSIWSLLKENEHPLIDKIFITASGGPFLKLSKKNFSKISVKNALKHPNWKMGKKISIDSSTMMNKLFEVIEAKKIFNLSYKKIKILIHPKSYVHALVKFSNGMTKILIHEPQMKIPIHNAIYYFDNKKFKTKELNLEILNNLDFQTVDYNKFPLVKILNILPKNDSLFETALISINDYFVSIYLKKKIDYKKLIFLINYYSYNKIFHKFKRKLPKNVNDIYETKNYVYEKLINSGI